MFSLISLNDNARAAFVAHSGKVATVSVVAAVVGVVFFFCLTVGSKNFLSANPTAAYIVGAISTLFIFDAIRYALIYKKSKANMAAVPPPVAPPAPPALAHVANPMPAPGINVGIDPVMASDIPPPLPATSVLRLEAILRRLNVDLSALPNELNQIIASYAEKRTVSYPGYKYEMYCSYEEIIRVIASWGKVEAILMNDEGAYHIFIVSFNEPIRFSSEGCGVTHRIGRSHNIGYTPFCLSGMHNPAIGKDNVILSNNMMAFDITCLRKDLLTHMTLSESRELLPDRRLTQINKESNCDWLVMEKRINSIFSELEIAEKILEWIKQSGLYILENGLNISQQFHKDQYPIDAIIQNYTAFGWQIVMKSEK